MKNKFFAPIKRKVNKIIINRRKSIFTKRRLNKEIELNDKFI